MLRTPITTCLIAATLGLGLPGGSAAATAIVGTVRSKAGRPLPGLALLEKGEIHNNVWDRGALVGRDGRFRIDLQEGGQYGLHVYSSGYIYSPNAIKVEAGKTLEVNIALVAEPTRENDPVIKRAGFEEKRKPSLVTLDVADPNHDLGPQVLAFNAAAGRAYAMKPPKPMRDLKANFPDGVYELEVQGAADPRDWHFVVADHQCNTTDILSYPHEPKPPKVIQ